MTLVASYYKCRRRPPRAFTEVETVIRTTTSSNNNSATTKTTSLWTSSQGEGTPKSILNRNGNLQLWNEKDISSQTKQELAAKKREKSEYRVFVRRKMPKNTTEFHIFSEWKWNDYSSRLEWEILNYWFCRDKQSLISMLQTARITVFSYWFYLSYYHLPDFNYFIID